MGEQLYNSEILRLALETAGFVRLGDAQGSAERRSAICGSRVIVDIVLDKHKRVARLGQEVRACALGQASASLLNRHAIGCDASALAAARDALRAYLAGEQDQPGDWADLAIFAPARAHSARHPAILLPFEAVVAAVADAMAAP
jgi:NifU-like protein involved in Fe-S cluster formation